MITEDLIATAGDQVRTYFYGLRDRLIRTGIAHAHMFPQGEELWRASGPEHDQQWSVHRGLGGKFLVVWERLA